MIISNQKTYIVLVNYNGFEDTIECLDSLLNLNCKNFQIIIVDNDSTDNSVLKINKTYNNIIIYNKEEAIEGMNVEKENKFNNPIILIDAKENKGFAAGNNIALKYILNKNDFDYVWFLNNDTIVENTSLNELIIGINKYKNIGAVGSKILYYDNKNLLQNMGTKIKRRSFFNLCEPIINLKQENIDNGQYDSDFEVNDIMGASLLVKKDTLNKIGLMPEEYFLYGEETDWNFNIQKNNYKLMTIYKSKVYHKKSNSTGGDLSDITLYYRTRNQLILNKKYMNIIKYLMFLCFYSLKRIIFAFLKLNKKQRQILIKGLIDGIQQKKGK